MKDWNDIKSQDSWEIFKIMGEFVEGFERLSRIGPCVSIFGSARTHPDNKYYALAEELAFQLTQHKFGVITGGGPGIMEAGNKGGNIIYEGTIEKLIGNEKSHTGKYLSLEFNS